MKRSLTLSFLFWSIYAHSQIGPVQVIPPAPSIQQMDNYTVYNVGLENGVAVENIPLYTIHIGKITIPISLTYHTVGVKYHQAQGELGQGWALSPYYHVSRTVMGRPDEAYPMPALANEDANSIATYFEGFSNSAKDAILTNYVSTANAELPPTTGFCDGEYDLFNYDIGTENNSFIISNRTAGQVSLFTPNTTSVSYQTAAPNNLTTIDYFTITDGNGIKYTLGKDLPSGNSLTCISNYSSGSAITGWYASRVSDPFGNVVSFTYESGTESANTTFEKYITIQDNFANQNEDPALTNAVGSVVTSGSHMSGYATQLVDQITTKNEKVVFYRNSSLLDSMVVFAPSGQVIRKAVMTYIIQDGYDVLSQIVISGPDLSSSQVYGFQYYDRGTSLGRDYWGYYSYNGFSDGDFPDFGTSITYSNGSLCGSVTAVYNAIPSMANMTDYVPGAEDNLSLKTVTFPTGGSRQYVYEPNLYPGYDEFTNQSDNKNMGIRVKTITSNDSMGNTTLITNYKYGANESGTGMVYDDLARSMYCIQGGVSVYAAASLIYSELSNYREYCSVCPYLSVLSMIPTIYYPMVTEYHQGGTPQNITYNGKTEHYFSYSEGSDLYDVNNTTAASNVCASGGVWNEPPVGASYVPSYDLWNRIFPTETKDYSYNSGSYQVVRDVRYGYTQVGIKSFIGLHVQEFAKAYPNFQPALKDYYYINGVNGSLGSFFNYQSYKLSCAANVLASKSETVYSVDGSTSVTSTSNYSYNNLAQETSEAKNDSKGRLVSVFNKYPFDYVISGTPGNSIAQGIAGLQTDNVLNPVIEKYVQRSNTDGSNVETISAVFNTYNASAPTMSGIATTDQAGPLSDFTPSSVQSMSIAIDSRYTPKLSLDAYDSYGNLLQQHMSDDINKAYLWDYNNSYPIAEVLDAVQSDIAYTSFEANGTGNWTIPDTARNRTAVALTGSLSYRLTYSNTISKSSLNSATTYIVSYWEDSTSNTVVINGTSATPKITIGGWTYYEAQITGAASIAVAGTGIIDELRLYPKGAQMSTYTYAPLIGMTTHCDASGHLTYYTYDGLGRLHLIKDQYGNILKRYDYEYQSANN